GSVLQPVRRACGCPWRYRGPRGSPRVDGAAVRYAPRRDVGFRAAAGRARMAGGNRGGCAMSIQVETRRTTAHRRHGIWIAALVHRLSGIALACFLPLHFLALGLAIESEARLDGFLTWAEQPIVKFAETGLVFLLSIHLLG